MHSAKGRANLLQTSNSNAQWLSKRMRSPLANVRSLLSSNTEFMFSNHSESTSPSKRIYLWVKMLLLERYSSKFFWKYGGIRCQLGCSGFYFLSFLSVDLLISRKSLEKIPSVHSRVPGSKVPYSSATLMALGFKGYNLVLRPNLKRRQFKRLWVYTWEPGELE